MVFRLLVAVIFVVVFRLLFVVVIVVVFRFLVVFHSVIVFSILVAVVFLRGVPAVVSAAVFVLLIVVFLGEVFSVFPGVLFVLIVLRIVVFLLICILKPGNSGRWCRGRSISVRTGRSIGTGIYRNIRKSICGCCFWKRSICRCRYFRGSRGSDRYGIVQMVFQFGKKAILCFGDPVFMRGFQSQENLSAFFQISHFHGSVCQIVRSLFQLLSSKPVAVKKSQTVVIEAICRNNIVQPVDGQLQIRIDLNPDSSVWGQADVPGSQHSQKEGRCQRSCG